MVFTLLGEFYYSKALEEFLRVAFFVCPFANKTPLCSMGSVKKKEAMMTLNVVKCAFAMLISAVIEKKKCAFSAALAKRSEKSFVKI